MGRDDNLTREMLKMPLNKSMGRTFLDELLIIITVIILCDCFSKTVATSNILGALMDSFVFVWKHMLPLTSHVQ